MPVIVNMKGEPESYSRMPRHQRQCQSCMVGVCYLLRLGAEGRALPHVSDRGRGRPLVDEAARAGVTGPEQAPATGLQVG